MNKISASIFFLLILLCAFESQACKLSIPERDISRFLAPPVSGHYLKCEDYPEDKCHCVEAVDPYASDYIDGQLIPNPDKKFARELAEKNAADAEKAQEAKCKSFSFKGKTIAELKAELNESLGCRK